MLKIQIIIHQENSALLGKRRSTTAMMARQAESEPEKLLKCVINMYICEEKNNNRAKYIFWV